MNKSELSEFGNRLRELRKNKNLTQSELAEKIELSTNFVGMVERGERNISILKVFRIAKALDITLSQFFEKL